MYGVDLANTGHQANVRGPTEDIDVEWTFETEDSLAATPIIVDGILYVGSQDEHFYAIDAESGNKEWSVDLGTSARRTPAFADGNIYVSGSRELLSIDAETGAVRWREDGTNSNPYYPLVVDEATGIVTDDEYIWRFDLETGSLEQVIDLLPDPFEMGVSEAPAIADGIAYVGYEDRLGAIDLEAGEQVWEFENEAGEIFHHISPAVANGLVYIGDVDGNFYAINTESGDLEWKYTDVTEVASSPSVADEFVYFGDGDRAIALDSIDGSKEWNADVGPTPDVKPIVTDEKLYLAVHRFLYVVKAKTGEELCSHEFGSDTGSPHTDTNHAMQAPPAIVNGALYVTTSNNTLHKLKSV
ncbi:Outer membrane protein assembly factor BamB, contains PQQ-like beta-propeller repeat [Natronobacterium gregoryi]|uniref:PQQ enzyme repeat-containing protein n=3 Tax=Natronobacterium gregoryi TaxID=44930 RepID=L0AGK5_NATGS|nr:PQQ enzyme repeat-containing protein [Natronobacterium gregoryi SP2]ELY74164.1 pyrrolo-quinoline quinone [Natronobacterium gregoryi SP2]PLK21522.1 pyrrolo-quinoline quinone [Natronobacterium gregoryi SP2]SFI75606.1 Outer membrane protein assembly factor BamB, contains PQQ-like beta-propeller repeat [Natronobacterium gregoryi]